MSPFKATRVAARRFWWRRVCRCIEPVELCTLPPEVRRLVHAVDRMLADWAESDEGRRKDIWRAVMNANAAVWDR